jgi:predicted DNA-binding protein (UPF0251 family)
MNRLTTLLSVLITELSDQLSVCAKRDLVTIRSRVEHEGLSFLTITLPDFGTAFEAALEEGVILENEFPSFGKLRSRRRPKFLSGFSDLVFDGNDALRSDADPDAIYAIRQICNFYKKLRLPCSGPREVAALRSYCANEAALRRADTRIREFHDPFLDRTAFVLTRIFQGIREEELACGHGPGATADRLRANARRRIRSWPERSEQAFPLETYAIPNWGWHGNLCGVRSLGILEEPPVKVVFVPKTLKAPRVIAIEPSHMQYMQQGVMKAMVKRISASPMTSMSVRFSDQEANREAAKAASIHRRDVTLDLKDASDLVSLALVQRVFVNTDLLDLLEASRSVHAVLPDGTSLVLAKFASMGSATCFPVEAFVFYVLIQAAMHEARGLTPSPATVRKFSSRISVFGDDIIIPKDMHKVVVAKLEAYGLKVNQRKSFVKSHFRESCGGDFWNGVDVRPVRLSEVIPDGDDRWSPKAVMNVSAVSDGFYRKGLWRTSQLLRDWVESELKRKVPRSLYETEGLTFFSAIWNDYNGWDSRLHRLVRRTVTYLPVRVPDDVRSDSVAALTLCLQNIGNDRSVDLESSVKSQSFRKKIGWAR